MYSDGLDAISIWNNVNSTNVEMLKNIFVPKMSTKYFGKLSIYVKCIQNTYVFRSQHLHLEQQHSRHLQQNINRKRLHQIQVFRK
jgi:hypothetical protein